MHSHVVGHTKILAHAPTEKERREDERREQKCNKKEDILEGVCERRVATSAKADHKIFLL